MKKVVLFLAFCMIAYANPTFTGGISFKIGGDLSAVGATIKIISNQKKSKPVIAGGVTYYPWQEDKSKKFGIDLSAGYNVNEHTTIMGGWDFLQHQPSVSLGIHPSKSNGVKAEAIDDVASSCSKTNSN